MKKLFVLSLVVLGSLLSNNVVAANNLTATVFEMSDNEDDIKKVKNENIKKMSNRKIGKFLGSKKFDKDGSLEDYLGGFLEVKNYKVKHFKFYRNKDTKEVIIINKKADEVIRTGDFL